MNIVGLTGGIGSGKSTVARMFEKLGVAVYVADDEAKKLMHTPTVKKKIIALLGESSYKDSMPDRAYIASKVFQDQQLLGKLNAIIHPEVKQHFIAWTKEQKGIYVIKEAAILFENGGYKDCDKTILVIAPKSKRIERVKKRDAIETKDVESRMKNQWDDEEKAKLADEIINNSEGMEELEYQVAIIHSKLLKNFS